MLRLHLRVGDTIDIDGGRVLVRLIDKEGPQIVLEFEANRSVAIRRSKSTEAPQVPRAPRTIA